MFKMDPIWTQKGKGFTVEIRKHTTNVKCPCIVNWTHIQQLKS